MVTRITPMPMADGSGRDTYILLDKDLKKGRLPDPLVFEGALRKASPRRLMQHGRGYQRWYSSSTRSQAYSPQVKSPVVSLPSSLGSSLKSGASTPRSMGSPRKAPAGFDSKKVDQLLNEPGFLQGALGPALRHRRRERDEI
mmetsp:Transcript_80933/g.142776  ORF Transcript_80933/g.142776 Transcript_80933/m.142776 type:complete len:142 (-) Transcript_80933:48-473(-)